MEKKEIYTTVHYINKKPVNVLENSTPKVNTDISTSTYIYFKDRETKYRFDVALLEDSMTLCVLGNSNHQQTIYLSLCNIITLKVQLHF